MAATFSEHELISRANLSFPCSMYQAIRDSMSITLAKDDKSVVFGEDVSPAPRTLRRPVG